MCPERNRMLCCRNICGTNRKKADSDPTHDVNNTQNIVIHIWRKGMVNLRDMLKMFSIRHIAVYCLHNTDLWTFGPFEIKQMCRHALSLQQSC